jgi:hypothetical protein
MGENVVRLFLLSILVALSLPIHAEPAPVDFADGAEPQVAIGNGGSLYVVYGKDKQILFTRSTDGAKTFTTPVKIAEAPILPLGMRRGPRIAVVKNAIVVTAITAQNARKRTDGDITAWRSSDDGQTWEDAGHVNDMLSSAREGLHDLASDGYQRLYCVWLDLRNDGKTQLYGSLSRDGGISWEQNTRIYESPDGHICECCHPSVAFDSQGTIHVLFRNYLAGNRDMYLTRSNDAAKFSVPKRLGLESWKLNGCPMDGGDLAIDAHDRPVTVWRQKTDLFVTTAEGTDQQLGVGRQPVVAINISGIYTAWLAANADLYVQTPGSQPHAISHNATDPVVITTLDSKSAYCLWESKGKLFATTLTPAAQ